MQAEERNRHGTYANPSLRALVAASDAAGSLPGVRGDPHIDTEDGASTE